MASKLASTFNSNESSASFQTCAQVAAILRRQFCDAEDVNIILAARIGTDHAIRFLESVNTASRPSRSLSASSDAEPPVLAGFLQRIAKSFCSANRIQHYLYIQVSPSQQHLKSPLPLFPRMQTTLAIIASRPPITLAQNITTLPMHYFPSRVLPPNKIRMSTTGYLGTTIKIPLNDELELESDNWLYIY